MSARKLLNTPLQFWTFVLLSTFAAFLIYELRDYANAFLGTIIFYVLFKPVMRRWYMEKGYNKHLVASIIVFLILAIMVLPCVMMAAFFIPKLSLFLSDSSFLIQSLYELEGKIVKLIGYKIITPENLTNLRIYLAEWANVVVGETLNLLANLLLMFFMVYFALINIGKLEDYLEEFLPFKPQTLRRFAVELRTMTYTNVILAPLLALLQGFCSFLAYWYLGLDQPLFWGIMTAVFSFLPVIGSAIIWVPAAIYLYTSGMHWQAYVMIGYGIAIIGVSDNLFRFIFARKIGDVHPMITILGILLGVHLFGIAGFIFGPLLLSYFFLMLDIYKQTYLSEQQEVVNS
ncbi:MAG: family transporter [Cytophagaceae bacterium]|jgi:predicted PurR-regulated permease PerM|nr:family transporter [Cytophagaceae bacterium]